MDYANPLMVIESTWSAGKELTMNEQKNEHDDNDKKIKVEVRTPDGERAKFNVSPAESIAELKNQAIEKLGIKPPPGVQFFLFLGGRRLPDNVSLRDAGVKDDAVLTLASEPQVGAVR
jgi:hypothetical protein